MRNHETSNVWPAFRDALRRERPGVVLSRIESHATSPGIPDVVAQVPSSPTGATRTVFVELKVGRWVEVDDGSDPGPEWFPCYPLGARRPRAVWGQCSPRRPAQAAWDAAHRRAAGHACIIARLSPARRLRDDRYPWLWVALATPTNPAHGPQVYYASAAHIAPMLDVPSPASLSAGPLRIGTGTAFRAQGRLR